MAKKDKNRYLLPSERQNQPEEPKKERKGFKKVLKYTGVFLLTIVVIVAVGFAGAFFTGRFDPEKIYITSLSINAEKEYVAISDNDTSFKTKVEFLPATANQLVLTSKIITGKDLIESMPQVTAGEEFEIKFAKDENGITKGGEIEIKFLDCSQSAYATLKVLIDVSLNTNYVEVESSGTEMEYNPATNALSTKVSTTITEEYCEEIRISANYDSMFNSYTGSWSDSENNSIANLNRLKKTILFYDETDTSIIGFGQDNKLMVEENLEGEKYYKIRFLSPASSLNPFELQLYIYRTYHMENIFSEELARSILTAIAENSFTIDDIDYATLNAFINAYVYESSTLESKNNFALFVNTNNGAIELLPSKISSKGIDNFKKALTDVLDYVFVGKKILITVENVIVSEINNTKDELKMKVLEDITYTIGDVKESLGITLSSEVGDGETPADPQILFNNLRKLDIILCEKSTLTSIESTDWFNNSSGTYDYVGKPHYIIDHDGDGKHDDGDALYRRVENSDEIQLIKNIVDGEAIWTLKTLSPTPAAGKYFLIYRYRNNDIKEYTIEGGSTGATNYILKDEMWYSVKGNKESLVTTTNVLKTLRGVLDDKYAVASIDVTWTKGTIAFNKNTSIVNPDRSTFVLNKEGSIFTFDGTSQKQIAHGSSRGVYYANDENNNVLGRTFTIGEGISNNENNVLINPQTEGETLEYTMVKWFVPYYKNIVNGIGSDGNYMDDKNLNTARYYFMPVLEGAYETNGFENGSGTDYYNPIPAKVRLTSVENTGGYLNGQEGWFMEIGTGNMTLQALNAMSEELNIPLYAVIIQTNLNNEPYFVEGDIVIPPDDELHQTPKQITYHYLAYTYENSTSTGHTLNIKYYVESLKIYVTGSNANNSGYLETNDSNIIKVSPGGSSEKGYFYVSNIDLSQYSGNNTTTHPYPSDDIYDPVKNIVLLNDGIDNLRNLKIALYNYYASFVDVSKIAYVIAASDVGYPEGNSVDVSSAVLVEDTYKGDNEWDNWAIKYEILASTIGGVGTYSYTFRTEYLYTNGGIKPPVTNDDHANNFYTQVKTSNIGIFKLMNVIS